MSRLPILACALALAGCALLTDVPREPAGRAPRETLDVFQLAGRIAVRHGAERFSAGIDWAHDGGRDEIALSGPLGQGLAQLTAGPAGAALETARHQRYEAADVDALAERLFGAPLPVSGMARWVVGRAAAGGKVQADSLGRPARLVENGWTIEFRQFEAESPDALPTLLHVWRDAVEVRLTIDSWELPR